jgi:hypothetical protein
MRVRLAAFAFVLASAAANFGCCGHKCHTRAACPPPCPPPCPAAVPAVPAVPVPPPGATIVPPAFPGR